MLSNTIRRCYVQVSIVRFAPSPVSALWQGRARIRQVSNRRRRLSAQCTLPSVRIDRQGTIDISVSSTQDGYIDKVPTLTSYRTGETTRIFSIKADTCG